MPAASNPTSGNILKRSDSRDLNRYPARMFTAAWFARAHGWEQHVSVSQWVGKQKEVWHARPWSCRRKEGRNSDVHIQYGWSWETLGKVKYASHRGANTVGVYSDEGLTVVRFVETKRRTAVAREGEGRRSGGFVFTGYGVSAEGDDKVLEREGGDGCTAGGMYSIP